MHSVPYTEQQIATQNFDRGYIAAIEDILDVQEELRKWRE